MKGLVLAVYVVPLSFENCNAPVPPLAVTVIEPFAPLLQETSTLVVETLIVVGCPTITLEAVVSQLLASFTLIW